MAYYYYDTTGMKGPFDRTQLQILVNNRKVLKETPVETDDGQRGLANQLIWLIFPPDQKRIIFGLFSGFGGVISWILNTVLLLLAVTVLAAAIGIAVCVIVFQDTPWIVLGWVPPTIQCSSKESYQESVRKIKDWWYSKQDKDYRDDHKETMSELKRLAAALKDGTIDFVKVQESMLEELDKEKLEQIDANDLSRLIDKWIKESNPKDGKDKDTGQKSLIKKPENTGVANGGSTKPFGSVPDEQPAKPMQIEAAAGNQEEDKEAVLRAKNAVARATAQKATEQAAREVRDRDPNYIANLYEWFNEQDARPEYGTPILKKKLEAAKTALDDAKREGFYDGIRAADEKLRNVKAEIAAVQDRIAAMKFYYDGGFDIEVKNDDGRTTMATISFANNVIDNGLRKATNRQLWRFCFPTDDCSVKYWWARYDCTIIGDTETMKELYKNAKNYVCRIYFTDYRDDGHCNIVRFEIRNKGGDSVPLQPINWGGQQQRPNLNGGNVPVSDKAQKAQQIQDIVNGFLAMQPDVYVRTPLTSFRDVIMPQIIVGIAQGKTTITVRNAGFLSGGNEETFFVERFLNASKALQFETIWRVACGREAVLNRTRMTPRQKQIVAACQEFGKRIVE